MISKELFSKHLIFALILYLIMISREVNAKIGDHSTSIPKGLLKIFILSKNFNLNFIFRDHSRRSSYCFRCCVHFFDNIYFNTNFYLHLCRSRSSYLYPVHPKREDTTTCLCAADFKCFNKYGSTDSTDKSNNC